ncbi:unnamed protein product [Rotaria sp. Silwood1]|nr:unnamed protein product [Rotaria sp. Silwood1]CAF3886383.1 unnamed protein product [Rotaria sp. Silwood1]CAF4957728.1 unnamed protein product [Rotaria sp. Silwood1]CAF4988295.1 unnamed protein product [Rotaria sp. Silwood1]
MTCLLDNYREIAEKITLIICYTLGTIVDIANCVVVAGDNRHRTNAIQSCLTLDSLKEYLLPKNSRTIDGQRHTHTLPAQIRHPENSLHKYHDNTKFAQSTLRDLKQLVCTLGNEAVFYLSQDDKCRIAMIIPAVHKQAPLLMTMKIQIKLPVDDFIVETKHKLIPSIYGAYLINEERVSYSVPTFAAVRSGKHDHSSAFAYAKDFDTFVQLSEFEQAALSNGTLKPVVILSVDDGPDENSRYPKRRSRLQELYLRNIIWILYLWLQMHLVD